MDEMITIKPIGHVRNEFDGQVPEGYETSISEIIVKPELGEGLHLIDENSHIVVVFWMDRVQKENRKILKLHPKGREDLPLMGVFATRSPHRPNPIGLRSVKLVGKDNNILRVEGLDALNETPVLDIKPYSSKHDHVKGAVAPWWVKKFADSKE